MEETRDIALFIGTIMLTLFIAVNCIGAMCWWVSHVWGLQ